MRGTSRRPIAAIVLVLAVIAATFPATTQAASAGDADTQIIGGRPANDYEFPYMAAILRADVSDRYQAQFCGGSLIDDRLVLTAAHCLQGLRPNDVDVLTASTNLFLGGGNRVRARYFFIHPGFQKRTLKNDVAVIELKKHAVGSWADPLELVGDDDADLWDLSESARVSGWGDRTNGRDQYPNRMWTVEVRMRADHQCGNYGSAYIASVMLCAGDLHSGGEGPCYGDSGGPLVVEDGDRIVQLGVVSWGYECALAGYPAVYSELAAMGGFLDPFVEGGFRDLPGWLKEAGAWLYDNGYSQGYPDTTFRDHLPISRGQFVNLLYAITGPHPPTDPNGFPDVPTWLDPAVDWAKAGDVVAGYKNGTFRPDRNITRAEAANILWKLFGEQGAPPHPFTDVPPWVDKAVSWLVDNGYAEGFPDNKYKPGNNITRGQSAFQLFNIYGP